MIPTFFSYAKSQGEVKFHLPLTESLTVSQLICTMFSRCLPNQKYDHSQCLQSVKNQKYCWKSWKNWDEPYKSLPSWKVFSRAALDSVQQLKRLFTSKCICINVKLMFITKRCNLFNQRIINPDFFSSFSPKRGWLEIFDLRFLKFFYNKPKI